MAIEYKIPTLEEMQKAVFLGISMYKEGQYKNLTFNVDKVHQMIKMWAADTNRFYVCLAYVDGKPRGLITGYQDGYWFADEHYATTTMFFVDPTYRGHRVAYTLLQKFRDWAFEKGVAKIYLANSTGVKSDAGERLYEKVGGERMGGLWIVSKE